MARRFVTDVPGIPASPSPIYDAVVTGDARHISGQLAVHEDGYRPGTARAEAERAFERVFPIAAEAGFAREDIASVDLALADLGDPPEVNALLGEPFDPRPARTVHEAARLPFGATVGVRAIAMRG